MAVYYMIPCSWPSGSTSSLPHNTGSSSSSSLPFRSGPPYPIYDSTNPSPMQTYYVFKLGSTAMNNIPPSGWQPPSFVNPHTGRFMPCYLPAGPSQISHSNAVNVPELGGRPAVRNTSRNIGSGGRLAANSGSGNRNAEGENKPMRGSLHQASPQGLSREGSSTPDDDRTLPQNEHARSRPSSSQGQNASAQGWPRWGPCPVFEENQEFNIEHENFPVLTKDVKKKKISKAAERTLDPYAMGSVVYLMRENKPHLSTLALGIDPTRLGYNLASTEPLYTKFQSPYSDELAEFDLAYDFPKSYYAEEPKPLNQDRFSKVETGKLFYMFYCVPKESYQEITKKALCKRGWVYHEELHMWYRTAYGKASVVLFDPNKLNTVRKDEIVIGNEESIDQVLENFKMQHLSSELEKRED